MRNRVIICEASEIIANGLAEIIDRMAQFDVVLRVDSPERLSEKIVATDANMLIVNPTLLGFEGKDFLLKLSKEYPHVTLIALVTSCLEHTCLAPYGGVIEIYDSKQKVINKLNEWVKDNNPSRLMVQKKSDALIMMSLELMP